MMNFMLLAIVVLGTIALVASAILFVVSKRFAVEEDPRLAKVAEVLPGANCGGCGFPGCSGMADALVRAADNGSLEGLNCPVGGSKVMSQVADLLEKKYVLISLYVGSADGANGGRSALQW